MQRRVLKAKAARTFSITLRWPLSFAQTVFIGCCVLVSLCDVADKGLPVYCNGQVPLRNNSDTFNVAFDSLRNLQSCFQMLARADMFLRRKPTAQTQQVRYRLTVSVGWMHVVAFGATTAVCITELLLMASGDINPNPGPGAGMEQEKGESSDVGNREDNEKTEQDCTSPFSLLHSEIAKMSKIVARIEKNKPTTGTKHRKKTSEC